jgi:hypothetical protein
VQFLYGNCEAAVLGFNARLVVDRATRPRPHGRSCH